jgi:hypothetical protein
MYLVGLVKMAGNPPIRGLIRERMRLALLLSRAYFDLIWRGSWALVNLRDWQISTPVGRWRDRATWEAFGL